jgi:hypothetical protein
VGLKRKATILSEHRKERGRVAGVVDVTVFKPTRERVPEKRSKAREDPGEEDSSKDVEMSSSDETHFSP